MEKNSEDLKDRVRKFQLESERLEREVDILRKSQSTNNDGMFLRVTTLEQ